MFHEGNRVLKSARSELVVKSLDHASKRCPNQLSFRTHGEPLHNKYGDITKLKFREVGSHIGDKRPLSACAFSPDGKQLLYGSWSGTCSLYSTIKYRVTQAWKGHEDRITGVAWHPSALVDNEDSAIGLATACADGNASIWTAGGNLLHVLRGHTNRLCRLKFHPFGDFLGTTSFDGTWRLWDIASGKEFLCQDGHARGVYDIAFHCDGALVATVGLDSHCWLWDLRSGRNILTLQGHTKQSLAVDFSPSGIHIATGGGDNSLRLWDMRKRACMAMIPAHTKLISQVKFAAVPSSVLATASYDKTINFTAVRTLNVFQTLNAHSNFITGMDIHSDCEAIGSVSLDRSVRLWSRTQHQG
eukprot:CAMPEP_0183819490 /NCGR_PEP_ID=MMETSP0803_2-20130417/64168_1 /TAXON_ID=195967 /ORGANISM="Crustomastix stigmata, Strain CCMP3273" /LENGTH=357 /DNA_ID=CAMNT_0026064379 /DNA_START=384 /DNA_END=1458 /DNA_ORIENTATION=+